MFALAAAWFFFFLRQQTDARLNRVLESAPFTPSARALALHKTLFIADLHADSLLFGRNLLEHSSIGHVDVPRMREGNVALQAFTIVSKVPAKRNIERNKADSDQILLVALASRWPMKTWSSLEARALYQASQLHKFAKDSGGHFVVIHDRPELESLVRRRAQGEDVVGGFLGIEGAQALDGKLEKLDELHTAGIRMIGLAHFFDNEFAGSAHGWKKTGLTPSGHDLVRQIEDKKMIVDLAHSSPQTISDVLAMATRPVVVSHSGVKGTCDNQRNLSDEQLRAIAKNGGVIGIGFWYTAVCGTDAKAIVRAIRYTSNLIGVDHVALGSDFDGAVTAPFDASGMIQITQALLDAGFSDEEIRKIMGGNALRFLQQNLP